MLQVIGIYCLTKIEEGQHLKGQYKMDYVSAFIFFIFVAIFIFLAFSSCMLVKKIFPSLTGSILYVLFSSVLFCIFIGIFALILYYISGSDPESTEAIGFIFYFLGFPTSFIVTLLNYYLNLQISISVVLLFACMMINSFLVGYLIHITTFS